MGLKEDNVYIGHLAERSGARDKMKEEKVAAVEVATGFNEVGLGVVPEKEVENCALYRSREKVCYYEKDWV